MQPYFVHLCVCVCVCERERELPISDLGISLFCSYLLKPSVMQMERGFNPFIQQKIQEIVPARLSIKVRRFSVLIEIRFYIYTCMCIMFVYLT